MSGAWWSSAASDDAALAALLDITGDGLALLDHDSRFLALNPPAVDVLGLPEADLVGRPAPFATAPDPERGPGAQTTTWSARGRRRELEYRLAPAPGTGHAVWFSDVTDARRQQERLRAIARAAASVTGMRSLRATLDAVAREVAMTANIAAVQILAIDDPRDEVRVLGMAGLGDATDFTERLSACRRLGADVRFLDVLERGEPEVVYHRKPAIMADPAWAPLHAIMGHADWDSFVSMPMVMRGTRLGVVNAFYEPGDDPGPNSLAFLEAMADHAAVAIHTARLLDRTRSQAQQDERRRLARELHDSVAQQLFSMRMQAKALRAQVDQPDPDPARVCGSAEELGELAQSALSDLRRLIFELRPLDLAEQGLVDAVTAHAASLHARTGLAVDVRAPADLRLDLSIDAEEDLYRIVSEALHNVVKHARATAVVIRFAPTRDGGVAVEVTDDGCGRDCGSEEADAAGSRLGLVSMRERTARWGGQLAVGPHPDGGWTVHVAFPGTGTGGSGNDGDR